MPQLKDRPGWLIEKLAIKNFIVIKSFEALIAAVIAIVTVAAVTIVAAIIAIATATVAAAICLFR